MLNNTTKISIVGLGYVGLPLFISLSKKFKTIGYDINETKIKDLQNGFDETKEVNLKKNNIFKKLNFTTSLLDIKDSDFFIITVPTPIDKNNKPDLRLIISATKSISSQIKKGSIIIYESTVYPGVTEEICAPLIEKYSKLKWKKDFFIGYSPERINPGDKKHSLDKVVKIVSGDTNMTLSKVSNLYKSIAKKGVYECNSIKVAEAAKVIENTQRDLNIALMNELSLIFEKLKINTHEVLNAASTKWNFHRFNPGFVGGHCIGVDPYYLTYKSQQLKYEPKIILAGRKINDSMSTYVAKKIIYFLKKNLFKKKIKTLILGITFKENCTDIRNSKIIDLIKVIKKTYPNIDVYDPWIQKNSLKDHNINVLKKNPIMNNYDCIVLAVPHSIFKKIGIKKILGFGKKKLLFFDLKSLFPRKYSIWSL